jgi:hypothetical protein
MECLVRISSLIYFVPDYSLSFFLTGFELIEPDWFLILAYIKPYNYLKISYEIYK